MFKDILAETDYLDLPLLALILFVAVFVVVVVVVWRRGAHDPKHEHLEQLPLEDDAGPAGSPGDEDERGRREGREGGDDA